MTGSMLLVDDDSGLTRLVARFLRDNGYEVGVETDGVRAVERIMREQPLLVILDLMLPGLDGLSVCRRVRHNYRGPIIILTALANDIDQVAGLETGADGYLAKPVEPRVLLAHVRALLRRNTAISTIETPVNAPPPLADRVTEDYDTDPQNAVGALLRISDSTRSVFVRGQAIRLTDAEYDLLRLLARNAGQVLSRDEILGALRGLEHDGLDRTIDLRVSRLRRKLGDNPRHPSMIKSVRGVGYMLTA